MRASVLVLIGLPLWWCHPAWADGLLAVDFQQNGDTVQPGYSQFAGAASQPGPTTSIFPTINGNVSVSLDAQVDSADMGGGYYDRGGLTDSGGFTYASLYDSFAYNNSPNTYAGSATTSITLTLSGPGIAPSTIYYMTFFSFDPDSGRPTTGTHTTSISGLSGTSGSAQIVWSDAAPPTSDDQYSDAEAFVSDSSGNLTFLVSDTYTGNTDSRSGVRLNAFILSAVPEPGTGWLVAAGLVLCGSWKARIR